MINRLFPNFTLAKHKATRRQRENNYWHYSGVLRLLTETFQQIKKKCSFYLDFLLASLISRLAKNWNLTICVCVCRVLPCCPCDQTPENVRCPAASRVWRCSPVHWLRRTRQPCPSSTLWPLPWSLTVVQTSANPAAGRAGSSMHTATMTSLQF